MHIHGNQMVLNAVNPYSAAAEKAAIAQRAAHMRRLRRKRTLEAQGSTGPTAGFEAGGWMHSAQRSQAAAEPDEVQYHPSQSGSVSDFA